MERIEYRDVLDRSHYVSRGQWDDEPDKIQWQDEETGLPCLIVRGPVGSLCGYVGLPSSHPLHGKGYGDCNVEVHGGLTFAGGCADTSRSRWQKHREQLLMPTHIDEAKRFPKGDAARRLKTWVPIIDDYEVWAERMRATAICHVPAPGEPDDVWWLGFDCAHAGDFSPSFDKPEQLGEPTGWGTLNSYRDVAYVESECRSLAAQLKALNPGYKLSSGTEEHALEEPPMTQQIPSPAKSANQAPPILSPAAPLRVVMNGDRLDIQASVDLEGLKKLRTMLEKYQGILEMMQPEKDEAAN